MNFWTRWDIGPCSQGKYANTVVRAIDAAAMVFPFQQKKVKRKGDTADASQIRMKAETVIAPNRLSRAVFELGSDWSTVTFCFPVAIFDVVVRETDLLAVPTASSQIEQLNAKRYARTAR